MVTTNAKVVDVRALELASPILRTGGVGTQSRPMGAPERQISARFRGTIEPRRAGRSGWFLEYDGALFDNVRDVFHCRKTQTNQCRPHGRRVGERAWLRLLDT